MQPRWKSKWVTRPCKAKHLKISSISACLKWAKYNLFSKKFPFDLTISMQVQSQLSFPQRLPFVQTQYQIWNTFRSVFPLHLFALPLCIRDSAAHNCYCRFSETFTPCILWSFVQYGHKLKQRKLQLNMRKIFFPLRVTEPWNRLPREVVESPSLEIFKTRLDRVLCSLLWVALLWQEGWTGWPTESFQPLPFCDSVILWFCDSVILHNHI